MVIAHCLIGCYFPVSSLTYPPCHVPALAAVVHCHPAIENARFIRRPHPSRSLLRPRQSHTLCPIGYPTLPTSLLSSTETTPGVIILLSLVSSTTKPVMSVPPMLETAPFAAPASGHEGRGRFYIKLLSRSCTFFSLLRSLVFAFFPAVAKRESLASRSCLFILQSLPLITFTLHISLTLFNYFLIFSPLHRRHAVHDLRPCWPVGCPAGCSCASLLP